MIPAADLRKAVFFTWLIVSAVAMAAAMAPFVLPSQTLYTLFPACEARLRGAPCLLCGMTTAWVHLAEGDWGTALASNQFSLTLWSLCVLNFIVAKAYVLITLLRQSQNGGFRSCS